LFLAYALVFWFLIFLPFFLSSVSIGEAFPFCFLSFLPRPPRFVSPQDVRWRRKVCSRAEDVLSVAAGFILIRGSNNGKGPVVSRTAVASKSRNPVSNGGLRTRITFAMFMCSKRKSTERAPTTGGATVSNILTTCGATQLSSENGVSG
jgi:hypothetical protein